MKTLNKLILSLTLLVTARGFAADVEEVNNKSYFGAVKSKMSSLANYISDSRVVRYAKNYFVNISEDIDAKKAKKYGFITAAIAGLSGAAYKYKDKLKNWSIKLKDKSVNAFSKLKAKLSSLNEDEKHKLAVRAGGAAAVLAAGAVAYKVYKSKVEKKNQDLEDKKNN